ncbi:MAG: hypothetical protein GWP14_07980 [Actinobacteria bacterium]|nr:hypothetical protein [Actinomycetota bacterium]
MAVGNYKPAYLLCLKTVTIVVVAVALCTSVGCNNFDRTGTAEGQSIVGPFQAKDENPFLQKDKEESTKRQEVVQLNVYRIVISPQDDASLGQLWSLLRPAQLIKSNKKLLSRNGLQIAVGGADDWPKAINIMGLGPPSQAEQNPAPTTDATARLDRQIETWLAEGLMAELSITNLPGEQTLFLYQPDGQLVGKTYEECYKLLVVTAKFQPTGQIQLQIMPALKTDPPRFTALHWMVKQRAGNEPERYVSLFEPLAFTAMVNPNEFLAIGRSEHVGDASFGAVFFRADQAQKLSTTVLLIVPKIMTNRKSKGFTGLGGSVPKELK